MTLRDALYARWKRAMAARRYRDAARLQLRLQEATHAALEVRQ